MPITADTKIKKGMSSVQNLNSALALKVDKTQVKGTLTEVIADNTTLNVASTASVKSVNDEVVLNLARIDALIDDTAVAGGTTTLSVDGIKALVAELDDTYYAADLTERDDDAVGIVIPLRVGVKVFVADASADARVGVDTDGTAFGANYVYNGTEWILIQTLQYRSIDVTPYVRYTEIVDSLDSILADRPLSANQGRILLGLVNAGVSSLVLAVDDVVVAVGGVIGLTRVARGEIVNGMALVQMDEGLIPVFVTVSADGATATILADDVTIYEGKDTRISYMTDGTATVADGGGGDGGSI